MTLFLPARGEVVAQASSPAGSGGVSPRESDPAPVLAAGRCGNPQPGRLRYKNRVKMHPLLHRRAAALPWPETALPHAKLRAAFA